MVALLIIGLIIVYFIIGYITTKVLDEYQVIDTERDDLLFTLSMIFFPLVLIGCGIKWAGNTVSDFIINLFR